MLHLVDVRPWDETDPVDNAVSIVRELENFSPTLHTRDRWLVLNKLDMVADGEQDAVCDEIVERLDWQDPVFCISGLTGSGTNTLCQAVMVYLEELAQLEREQPELAEREFMTQKAMQEEARERIQELKRRQYESRNEATERTLGYDMDEIDDDDSDDAEVFYVRE